MRAMTMAAPAAVFLAAAMSFGPAFGQASDVQGGINATRAVTVQDTNIKPYQSPDTSEGAAEEMRLKGECDKAVPLLRQYATRDGNSIAQFNLGMCLLDLANRAHDADPMSAERKEAAKWIVQAANANAAKAQAEAVVLYLDGIGIAPDPVEAAKWSILYRRNGVVLAVGMGDLTQSIRDKLDAVLTDKARSQAESRADDWTDAFQKADR
jgi:TPR repeat protein